MPKVIYELVDGSIRELTGDRGSSVMQVARSNGVTGIAAECGGAAMCATCHVYVDPAWLPKLPAVDSVEDELLEGVAASREQNSRLSCQLLIDENLDGLRVLIPVTQY